MSLEEGGNDMSKQDVFAVYEMRNDFINKQCMLLYGSLFEGAVSEAD